MIFTNDKDFHVQLERRPNEVVCSVFRGATGEVIVKLGNEFSIGLSADEALRWAELLITHAEPKPAGGTPYLPSWALGLKENGQ